MNLYVMTIFQIIYQERVKKMEKFVATLKNVWGKIVEFFKNLWSKIVEISKKVWTAVVNFFKTLGGKIKALFAKKN